MSIKTLFDKQKQLSIPLKTVESKNVYQISEEVESSEYISEYQKSINLYLQDVNFATASNFAKFGSARKYYENITNRITGYFPYDGSKAEQLEFENNLNPFEKYIYKYEFPRSTGYVNFSPNGWGSRSGTDPDYGIGLPNNVEYISFYNQNNNNLYNPEKGLRENTRFIFASGSTLEFWMKKDSFADSSTETSVETIFYLASTGSDNKDKRFTAHMIVSGYPSSIICRYDVSSSAKFVFVYNTGLSTIADSTWHHYAITFYSASAGYKSDFYFDGVYKNTQTYAGTIVDFTGSMFGTIGSLGGPFINTAYDLTGYGKLKGSIDELRFWNVKRDAKQIGLNYFTTIGGGNDLVSNSNIGIYYKFNEGITGDTDTDKIILDYAGRNCNGLFTGYASSSRSTGSAITDTQETSEIGTPILYETHPDVQTFLEEKLLLADEYDFSNNFALKNSMPSWILDEDSNNGDALVNFLQTIASYLDTLYLQITTYKNLKNKEYLNFKGNAPPFSDLLLTSNGFDLPSLFLNTDIIQELMGQDNKKSYDEKLENIKNVIYKNIYNNLIAINKSKGTESSIKQLIKSFGVGEDVFSINIYADNTTYSLDNSYANKSIKKDYIDFTPFSASLNSSAVIYQDETDSGSRAFITGTSNPSLSFTAECDVIIPEFPKNYDILAYQTLTYNTSSIFGIRTAENTVGDTTVPANDYAGIKVRLVRRDDKGYFEMAYPSAGITLTSSIFDDITTEQHWNLSIRLYPVMTGSSYVVEFAGFSNYVSDLFNSFSVSSSISNLRGTLLLSNNKRLYIGAERENITGSVVYNSMFKGLSARYWSDYLTNEELKEHAKNPNNYGRNFPLEAYTLSTSSYIPKSETLLLHWDFSNITSSDSSGNISNVYDLTSGSVSGTTYSNTPLENLVGYAYNGKGYGFEPDSTIKSKQLVYSSEQQLPESLYSSQLINILSSDDKYYNSSIRPQKYFFAIENSMYDVISKNMINMFASLSEYNNLVGNPLNTYKSQYSRLKFLRKLFFDKIGNTPDLDKYVGIYKWIDDALDSVLFNLLPASANASDKVRTVIENHILERSKIQYPLIPDKSVITIGSNSGATGTENDLKNTFDPGKKLPRGKVWATKKRGVYRTGPQIQPDGRGIETSEGILSPLRPGNPTDPSSYQRGITSGRIGNKR